MCVLLFQEQQKVEEEWSPRSVDVLVFLSHQLHRFLLLYCDNDQVLDDVGRSIGLLAEIEESMEEACHTSYVANELPSQSRRGRPNLIFARTRLNIFTCISLVSSLLGVSLRTVRRRMTEYGLSVSGLYSEISNCELVRLVNRIRSSFPNFGYRMMNGHLHQRRIRVTQARIQSSMHRVDPEGVTLLWREAIQRRKYRVSSPLALWHIDGITS